MADRTKIEWTDATWNAIRGCSRVSAGCANCYAESLAARFSLPDQWGHLIAIRDDEGRGHWLGSVVLDEKALLKPLHRRKPRRIFVTSVGDPFHPAVTDEMLDRLFAVMALCPQHTFQLLTKRPDRMRTYLSDPSVRDRVLLQMQTMFGPGWPRWLYDEIRDWADNGGFPLPNLWLGVSVEHQSAADERVPHLLDTPAAVRFISAEPLLGSVDLGTSLLATPGPCWPGGELPGINWVIVGGESGPRARPMHPDWARSLRDQCAAAGVPFYFKQWGEHLPVGQVLPGFGKVHGATAVKPGRMKLHYGETREQEPKHAFAERGIGFSSTADGRLTFLVGKKSAGHLLDGREHRSFPSET